MTEEKINANYLSFIKYLEKYGCYSEEMFNEIGEKIKYAPYSTQLDYGGCESGSMVDITLNVLCRIGAELNNNVFGNESTTYNKSLYVNHSMLMRVLLLLNVAKAEMFVENQNDWAVKKHGKLYDVADNKTMMKLGARSLYLCQKYGIKLEEEEFDAFLAIDTSEENGERYRTPLYSIVKAAKMFTLVALRQKYMFEHPKETIEK